MGLRGTSPWMPSSGASRSSWRCGIEATTPRRHAARLGRVAALLRRRAEKGSANKFRQDTHTRSEVGGGRADPSPPRQPAVRPPAPALAVVGAEASGGVGPGGLPPGGRSGRSGAWGSRGVGEQPDKAKAAADAARALAVGACPTAERHALVAAAQAGLEAAGPGGRATARRPRQLGAAPRPWPSGEARSRTRPMWSASVPPCPKVRRPPRPPGKRRARPRPSSSASMQRRCKSKRSLRPPWWSPRPHRGGHRGHPRAHAGRSGRRAGAHGVPSGPRCSASGGGGPSPFSAEAAGDTVRCHEECHVPRVACRHVPSCHNLSHGSSVQSGVVRNGLERCTHATEPIARQPLRRMAMPRR